MVPAFFNSNTDRQFRLVSAGIRVKYIGSNLYNSGRVTLYRDQGNDPIQISGTTTSNGFLTNNYAIAVPVSRGTQSVTYAPSNASEFSYQNMDLTYALTPLALVDYCLICYIDGAQLAPNQQSWEFEAVANFEGIGANLTLTPSFSDPVGLGATMSSLPTRNPEGDLTSVVEGVFTRMGNAMWEGASGILSGIERLAPAVAGSIASGLTGNFILPHQQTLAITDY